MRPRGRPSSYKARHATTRFKRRLLLDPSRYKTYRFVTYRMRTVHIWRRRSPAIGPPSPKVESIPGATIYHADDNLSRERQSQRRTAVHGVEHTLKEDRIRCRATLGELTNDLQATQNRTSDAYARNRGCDWKLRKRRFYPGRFSPARRTQLAKPEARLS